MTTRRGASTAVALGIGHRIAASPRRRIHTSPKLMGTTKSLHFLWQMFACSCWTQRACTSKSRARAFLGAAGDDVKHLDGWYLEKDATNHMMGFVEVFSNLDRFMVGSVKFGDGSMVSIQGRGSIVFTSKCCAHNVLTGVYYIRWLRNSIVCLVRLDENGTTISSTTTCFVFAI